VGFCASFSPRALVTCAIFDRDKGDKLAVSFRLLASFPPYFFLCLLARPFLNTLPFLSIPIQTIFLMALTGTLVPARDLAGTF
jgi:hypothetical protein